MNGDKVAACQSLRRAGSKDDTPESAAAGGSRGHRVGTLATPLKTQTKQRENRAQWRRQAGLLRHSCALVQEHQFSGQRDRPSFAGYLGRAGFPRAYQGERSLCCRKGGAWTPSPLPNPLCSCEELTHAAALAPSLSPQDMEGNRFK